MSWVHKPLESPRLYNLVQRLLGAGGQPLDGVYDRGFGRSSGLVLDVGCGPVQETPLPEGTLVGLDINLGYIERYVAGGATLETAPVSERAAETSASPRLGDAAPRCSVLGVAGSAAELPFADETFDECRCVTVLHHLPDTLARRTLSEMDRVLKPGGTLAILDMVRPPGVRQGLLAWILCALDRGHHVRTGARLATMVQDQLPGAWSEESFLYAWPRLHGLLLIWRKEALESR